MKRLILSNVPLAVAVIAVVVIVAAMAVAAVAADASPRHATVSNSQTTSPSLPEQPG